MGARSAGATAGRPTRLESRSAFRGQGIDLGVLSVAGVTNNQGLFTKEDFRIDLQRKQVTAQQERSPL